MGEAETGPVDGVEEVEERVVQLGGEIEEVEVMVVRMTWLGFLVCDGVGAARRRYLGAARKMNHGTESRAGGGGGGDGASG